MPIGEGAVLLCHHLFKGVNPIACTQRRTQMHAVSLARQLQRNVCVHAEIGNEVSSGVWTCAPHPPALPAIMVARCTCNT